MMHYKTHVPARFSVEDQMSEVRLLLLCYIMHRIAVCTLAWGSGGEVTVCCVDAFIMMDETNKRIVLCGLAGAFVA